jgi:hypothetical protein
LVLLSLSDNKITSIGACEVAEAIKDNEILTDLYLANNDIDTVGAKALADSLKNK